MNETLAPPIEHAREYRSFYHWLWESPRGLAPDLNWRPADELAALDYEFERLMWRDDQP